MKSWLKPSLLLVSLIFSSGVAAQNIPEPPPPTPVNGSGRNYPAPKPRTCAQYKTYTTRYVCGTEKVCQNFPNRGTVCHDKEKYCERTIEQCVRWN